MAEEIVKIVDLTELTEVDAENDFLVVHDTSETVESQKTKKVKPSNLAVDMESILNVIYPIGIKIELYVSTNPNTLFGGFGTWALCSVGRTTVGYDASQTEFNAIGKQSGEKTHTLTTAQMPVHTHTQNSHQHTIGDRDWRVQNLPSGGDGVWVREGGGASTTGNTTATNQNTGGGAAHNNLQPSETVYMWRRTE
jgi:microcystin-dependent protein